MEENRKIEKEEKEKEREIEFGNEREKEFGNEKEKEEEKESGKEKNKYELDKNKKIPECLLEVSIQVFNSEKELKTLKDAWYFFIEDFERFQLSIDVLPPTPVSSSLLFTTNFTILMDTMKQNRKNQQIIQYLQIIIDYYIEFFSIHINNPNIYPSMYRLFTFLPIQTTFLLFRNIKTGNLTTDNRILFKSGLSECDFITATDCEKLIDILNKM